MKRILSIIILLLFCQRLLAQYTVNGNAQQISCNCYILTQEQTFQSGSVWNNNKIDLTQSFDFKFDVNLGRFDANGADGIAFVLQPISTSVGSAGGGLGYENITPAVGVTIDTWQNTVNNDPVYDHIAIQLNGNLDHNSVNNIAGPVTVINGNDNVEDGNVHSLRIQWNAFTKLFSVYVDGSLRVSAVKDFVTDVFSGNPMVFWGFTGSTGGSVNLQKFCTALNPYFHFAPNQKRCVNEPITFYDSTISFTLLAKFWWDFGDGSAIDSVNLNPVHTYTVAGDYTVIQKVRGADGCEATNTQIVRIGSKPLVVFINNTNECNLAPVQFTSSSVVSVGTINNWYWDFDNGTIGTVQNPTATYMTGGNKNVKLAVKTLEGCESDTLLKVIYIKTRPEIDFTFTDSVCLGTAISFSGLVVSAVDPVIAWQWHFDNDPVFINTQNATYTFATAGNHYVFLLGSSAATYSCIAVTGKNVFVVDKPHTLIKNNSICQFVPTVLQDSSYTNDGFAITGHWWDLGNGQFSTQQNPIVTYNALGPVTVKHFVSNSRGCVSDTVIKTLFIKPSPNVSFSFNDVCKNDPVSFTAVDNSGTVTQWQWTFGDGGVANTKDAQHTYTVAGTYKVILIALAPNACYNDTLRKDIIIYSTNAFAGNDTITASGRPLQLQASGGISYEWSPTTGINNPFIPNPIAVLTGTQTYTYTLRAYTPQGCESFDDITIQVYQAPEIYLPNAFTPNGDGLNDVYKGKPIGIKDFKYLKIFNRFGQQVFYTTNYQNGWDGTLKGKKQNSGVYVVIARGIDYRGIVVERQGTVMLIR